MKLPIASFVIPSYNSVTFLPHAVKSALEQSFKEIEVIIVNDASTDMTFQYLDWLVKKDDSRIRIINNNENKGRSESRNIGNTSACGQFIFVLDADDLAAPNRVDLSLKKLANVPFVYGSATIMDALGNKVSEIRSDVFNLDNAISTKQNRIVHSSVAYSKSFAMNNPYEPGEVARLGIDDWAQQIRAATNGVKFDYIPQTICAYRSHSGTITNSRNMKEVNEFKDKYISERLHTDLVTA